jgi:hypothetical protein
MEPYSCQIWKRHCLLAWALLVVSMFGCGGGNVGQVSGTISLNGQPVGPGSILFDPTGEENGSRLAAIGQVGADGKYSLVMAGNRPGAQVGKYRVTIRPNAGTLGDEDPVASTKNSAIHARYSNADTSGLTADVKPGSQTIDFDLKP